MAWSAPGLFLGTQMDQWDPSDLGIDLTAEDGKLALWGSSITPDYNAATPTYGSSPWNSGQSTGAGYTAGGPLVLGTTLAIVSSALMYDFDNIELTETTLTTEGGIVYFPNKSNRIFLGMWWGEVLETQDGTFLLTPNSLGAARLTN